VRIYQFIIETYVNKSATTGMVKRAAFKGNEWFSRIEDTSRKENMMRAVDH